MMHYVCGFVFDPLAQVYLIRKLKPDWQKGLLNGIGGKIETADEGGEYPASVTAMSREFEEEAGVLIHPLRWKLFHKEQWKNGNSVDFYTAGLLPSELPTTKTEEVVLPLRWRFFNAQEWSFHQVMYNLPYLIPMAYIYLYSKPELLPFHDTPLPLK
jgi:8-oxo-dGTP diphosphatase